MKMLREAAASALVTMFGLAACGPRVPTVVVGAAGAGALDADAPPAPDAGTPIPSGPVVIPPTVRFPPNAPRRGTLPESEPCPDDFAAAQQRVGCTIAVTNGCAYGRSRCTCTVPPQCGGAVMMPPGPGERGNWSCESTDPKQLAPGGCPYVQPAAGSKCAKSGLSCFFGTCSWAGTRTTCEGGKWKSEQVMMGPPP